MTSMNAGRPAGPDQPATSRGPVHGKPAEAAIPNGPAAAALLAAGIGSAVLGINIVLVEASPAIKKLLNFYDPVGPLSGKTTVAVVVFVLAWIGLGAWVRDKNVRFGRWMAAAFGLLGVGLVLSFPPVFEAFAPGH